MRSNPGVPGSIPGGPAKPSIEKRVTCGCMRKMLWNEKQMMREKPSPFPLRPGSDRLKPDKTVAVRFNTCRFSEYAITNAHFNTGSFVFRFAQLSIILNWNVWEDCLRRYSNADVGLLGYSGVDNNLGRPPRSITREDIVHSENDSAIGESSFHSCCNRRRDLFALTRRHLKFDLLRELNWKKGERDSA